MLDRDGSRKPVEFDAGLGLDSPLNAQGQLHREISRLTETSAAKSRAILFFVYVFVSLT